MTDLIKVILDEGGPSKQIVRKGYCQIVPNKRFPTDGMIVGRITDHKFFHRSSQPPYMMLLPCDLFGPQRDDNTPDWCYIVKYSPDFPGHPLPWKFVLLSTNGSVQKLSDLMSMPPSTPSGGSGSGNYDGGTPDLGNLPVATFDGGTPSSSSPTMVIDGGTP